ncbi:MAG: M20/M25/M40 family metallo-hydrolase [Anaerolineaceae bacterium]|nr:M20/M25/M40 family metallo-hydrolase [Anaerolineaceae bacterium]
MFKDKKWILILIECIALAAIGGVFAFGNHLPSAENIPPTSTPEPLPAETEENLPTPTPLPSATPTAEPTPAPVTIDPVTWFLSDTSQERYAHWIRALSGDIPVTISGQEYTITTRYSYAMFTGQENARASEYLIEQLSQWVPPEQITYEPYEYRDAMSAYTWYNIIVTFPGTVSPDEQILYTAHYDSCVALTDVNPLELAPGANDNGTGVAALLEAIPTFAKTSFEKTVKVIFFSGEENRMQGSYAYVAAHSSDNIIGVINMDMFGNDPENARCFEIHVGSMPESDPLGRAFEAAIRDYGLDLTYDYFNYAAYELGDHTPFWQQGIPAMTAMENFTKDSTEGGCGPRPYPKNWHAPTDFIADVNIPYAFDIARAGTITVLRLAGARPITGGS